MNRTVLIAAAAFFAAAGAAQAQDTTTNYTSSSTSSYGPMRFGVTAGPVNTYNSAAQYERDNPVNQTPWSNRVNAAPSDKGPSLGPEGGGTPMSRGGVNDTLMGSNTSATFNQLATLPANPKPGDKGKTADAKAQGEKPKP